MSERRLLSTRFATAVWLCAVVQGCFHAPQITASGKVAGYAMSAPVDSVVARDYIEGRPLPAALEDTRRQMIASGRIPSRDILTKVDQEYSPDVATLLFIEALNANPANRALRERFETELAQVRRVGIGGSRPNMPGNLLVLLVPGWFYVKHGSTTGGDFRTEREILDRLAVANRLVPVDENGTVEANARTVARAIRDAGKQHQILLVSASKSGPEVAQALGRELRPDESTNVVGWVSIGGVVRGSPVADRILRPDICWAIRLKLALEGFDLEGAKSLRTDRAGRVFDTLHLPSHVKIISFVPTPLSGNITKRAEFGYGCMKSLGPNDGLVLLRDELIPSGTPLLAVGFDHFLMQEERDLWTAALFRVMVSDIAGHQRT